MIFVISAARAAPAGCKFPAQLEIMQGPTILMVGLFLRGVNWKEIEKGTLYPKLIESAQVVVQYLKRQVR